jgi:hypothetical protein
VSGRVPRSRAARVADVFRRFTGREAVPVGEFEAPIVPESAYVIGSLDAVEYTVERDGVVERYRHLFRTADRPLLALSDVDQILVLGGRYRWTELGIVDDSDRKNANAR